MSEAVPTDAAPPTTSVRAYPNPFDDSDYIEAEVDGGLTIAEITGRPDLPALVIADGRVIDCEEWLSYVPGGPVVIRRVPAGGDTARTLGSIAVLALAVWAGPAAMTAYAGTGVMMSKAMIGIGGAVISVGLGIAGPPLVNHTVPPFAHQGETA
jgi:hypothetical protein